MFTCIRSIDIRRVCRVGVGLVRYNRFISYLGEPWLLGDLNCLDMVILGADWEKDRGRGLYGSFLILARRNPFR